MKIDSRKRKEKKAILLSFAFISFSESGLFNELQRIQIKILPSPGHTVSQMSHAIAKALGSIRRVGTCIARIQLIVNPMSLLVQAKTALSRGVHEKEHN
jgi:hypothetical protein